MYKKSPIRANADRAVCFYRLYQYFLALPHLAFLSDLSRDYSCIFLDSFMLVTQSP